MINMLKSSAIFVVKNWFFFHSNLSEINDFVENSLVASPYPLIMQPKRLFSANLAAQFEIITDFSKTPAIFTVKLTLNQIKAKLNEIQRNLQTKPVNCNPIWNIIERLGTFRVQ